MRKRKKPKPNHPWNHRNRMILHEGKMIPYEPSVWAGIQGNPEKPDDDMIWAEQIMQEVMGR